ncbi:hypothetical protein FORC17_0914 [Vibrio vulnificus]|nr:hypothetical protein FORC17_0914 [Vibrio vulnificus]
MQVTVFKWFDIFLCLFFRKFDSQNNLLQSNNRNLQVLVSFLRISKSVSKKQKGTGQGTPKLRKGSGLL